MSGKKKVQSARSGGREGGVAHCHLNRKNLIVDGALYGWTVMRREREGGRERERDGRERRASDLDECFEND